MIRTLPVNFNERREHIVLIEADCDGKKIFAGLEYKTSGSVNELTEGIKNGKLTQVEFQETQWIYDKFGYNFVYSQPGFSGVR